MVIPKPYRSWFKPMHNSCTIHAQCFQPKPLKINHTLHNFVHQKFPHKCTLPYLKKVKSIHSTFFFSSPFYF